MVITRTDSWRTALDNYDPPRFFTSGTLDWTVIAGTNRPTGILRNIRELKDPHKALYVLDDGKSARVMYVAGWARTDPSSEITAAQADHLLLVDLPINATGETRQDNGNVIDFDSWMLGPRRTYHLKVTPPSFDTSDVYAPLRRDRSGQRLRVGSRVRVWPYPGEAFLNHTAAIVRFDFTEGPQAVLRADEEFLRYLDRDLAHLPTNLNRCELLTF